MSYRVFNFLIIIFFILFPVVIPAQTIDPSRAFLESDESQPPVSAKRYYFYDPSADYGVQALYSPVFVLVNRGFDIIQAEVGLRSFYDFNWKFSLNNVWDNVRHFPTRVSEYGWKPFLKREIFPLSFTEKTARWVPNYALHLIGGGMTYRMLCEWLGNRNVPLPWLWSSTIVMMTAFMNEAIENNDTSGRNIDSIADIVFFDTGGILLFSIDIFPKFFSRYFHLSDWSLQPGFTFPEGRLHNAGNYFMARLEVFDPVSLFVFFGNGTWSGLSFRFRGEERISAAIGVYDSRLVTIIDRETEYHTLQLTPTAGLFWDRNSTPLVSFIYRDVADQRYALNIYPGIVLPGRWSPGIWIVAGQGGSWTAGVALSCALGIGTGFESSGMRGLDP